MTRDPDYNLTVYGSIEPQHKPWLVRVKHPRTKLHIFFEGATKDEAVNLAESFWAEYQQEREAAWAKQEAAKLAREAKKEPK